MANLPTFASDWGNSVLKNRTVSAVGAGSWQEAIRIIGFRFKQCILGDGLTYPGDPGSLERPWTLVASCGYVGGTVWTASAADNIATKEAVWYAANGNDHTWFVVEVAVDAGGGGGTMQLCFSFETENYWLVYLSPSGAFANFNSTANRPTAADEQYVGAWMTPEDQLAGRYHVWAAPDGTSLRIALYLNGVLRSWGMVEVLKNERPGWVTRPVIGWFAGNGGFGSPGGIASFDFSNSITNIRANAYLSGKIAGSPVVMYHSYESFRNLPAVIGQTVSDLDGGFASCELGVWSNTAPVGGKAGTMRDIWMVPLPDSLPVPFAEGDTAPADASRHFVHVGPYLLPWDTGAAPGAGVVCEISG